MSPVLPRSQALLRIPLAALFVLAWPVAAQPLRPASSSPPPSLQLPAGLGASGEPLSCAYCDLRGMDLSGRDLTNANLVGSDLRGTKLTSTKLDGAVLTGANLEGADLSGARLNPASNGPADLTGANLAGASFRDAELTGAHLSFAALQGADFSGANLTGAVLGPRPNTGMLNGRRTSFRGARLERRSAPDAITADLSGATWVEPKVLRAAPTQAGIACGASDLSGLTNPIYVSTEGTDNAGCGAGPGSACRSLAHALTRCTSSSCNLLAMYGEFDLPATLSLDTATTPNGARLYGGCMPSAQADSSLSSAMVAPPGGLPAVSITGVKPVVLENFKILGSDAAAGKGAPAVTVQVTQGAQVTLNNSFVVGGRGGTGATGANQPAGATGGAANGQNAGTNASCTDSNGGTGAGAMNVDHKYTECDWPCTTPGCIGGFGSPGTTSSQAEPGGFGEPFTTFCPPMTPNDGHGGKGGASAGCGTGGTAASSTKGSFAGATWTPGVGGTGTPGGNGGGGGGGGSGGAYCTLCFLVPSSYPGSSGGGGGAGGCGGQPAPGGQQGGGSFAIVAANGSAVALNQSRVVAGRSGDGGAGGGGGGGGAGGKPAVGAGTSGYGYHGGKGGDGGSGGMGGGGGGGAGGNGGPAAGLALVSGSSVSGTGIVYYNGSSGNFGGGGSGGTSVICPTGPAGQPGVPGLVTEVVTYP